MFTPWPGLSRPSTAFLTHATAASRRGCAEQVRARGRRLGEMRWGVAALLVSALAGCAEQIVTPNCPDGFTVTDGNGQWQNPATREITRQPTKIVLVAARRTPD